MDLHHCHVSPRSVELVDEVLRSGWLSEGPMVKRLEENLACGLGAAGPVTTNSGTSAMHLALAVAGVGPGDEVILSPQGFIATGMVILLQGATPVFADVCPRTGNLSPASVGEKVTSRTKAVMPVDLSGLPCDLDEMNEVAREHGLAVVEDAAQALGATYQGRPVGAVSRFTAFSFHPTKHVATGDGGALCCARPDDEREARRRRWFGVDRAERPGPLGERERNVNVVGHKHHMCDLVAAVALGNLGDLAPRLARRREIAARLRRELAREPGLDLLRAPADRESACWAFTVLAGRRDDLIRALRARGVPASVVHLRMDAHPVFGGERDDLPGQAWFDRRQLSLPCHEGLADDDVEVIIRAVRRGW